MMVMIIIMMMMIIIILFNSKAINGEYLREDKSKFHAGVEPQSVLMRQSSLLSFQKCDSR